jgi:hypothetical protein
MVQVFLHGFQRSAADPNLRFLWHQDGTLQLNESPKGGPARTLKMHRKDTAKNRPGTGWHSLAYELRPGRVALYWNGVAIYDGEYKPEGMDRAIGFYVYAGQDKPGFLEVRNTRCRPLK